MSQHGDAAIADSITPKQQRFATLRIDQAVAIAGIA